MTDLYDEMFGTTLSRWDAERDDDFGDEVEEEEDDFDFDDEDEVEPLY